MFTVMNKYTLKFRVLFLEKVYFGTKFHSMLCLSDHDAEIKVLNSLNITVQSYFVPLTLKTTF